MLDQEPFYDEAYGDWGRYLLQEAIPLALRRTRADPHRVAIGGVGLGGFGAFSVARLRPGRFCAVGGHTARIARTDDETRVLDGKDFARNDLIALARARGRAPWGRARLWLDAGREDESNGPGGEAFAAALGIPMRRLDGNRGHGYWREHYGPYLRFYADALAAC